MAGPCWRMGGGRGREATDRRSQRRRGWERMAAVGSRTDEQGRSRTCLFQDQSQQRLDELVELDFTGKSLERLDHVGQIDLRLRRAARRGRAGVSGLVDLGKFTVEERDLCGGPPLRVAGARVAEMCVCIPGQALVQVEARRPFASQALRMEKPLFSGRGDGVVIQVQRLQVPAFDARLLGQDELVATGELGRAIRGPSPKPDAARVP